MGAMAGGAARPQVGGGKGQPQQPQMGGGKGQLPRQQLPGGKGQPQPPQMGGGKGQLPPQDPRAYRHDLQNQYAQLQDPTMTRGQYVHQGMDQYNNQPPQMGGGKGGQRGGMSDLQRSYQQQPYQPTPDVMQGGMNNAYIRPDAGIYNAAGQEMPGSMGGQPQMGGFRHRGWEGRHQGWQGQPQMGGLASLQQPTATTEALTPTPASDQPYMGNYLQ